MTNRTEDRAMPTRPVTRSSEAPFDWEDETNWAVTLAGAKRPRRPTHTSDPSASQPKGQSMHNDPSTASSPPGYAVAYLRDVELDSPAIAEYLTRIDATLTPHQGEFLVHGTTPEAVEGEWPGSIVLIRFPSVDQARAWYGSPGYQAILPLRTKHSHSIAAMLDGVPVDYRAASLLASMAGASRSADA